MGNNQKVKIRVKNVTSNRTFTKRSKGWFEKEFYSPKFEKFIAWTHKTLPQIIFMVINLALIATCIAIAAANGAIGYTPAPFFLS